MKTHYFLGLALSCILTLGASAQQPDTLIRKLDSLGRKTDSADEQVNNIAPAAYN